MGVFFTGSQKVSRMAKSFQKSEGQTAFRFFHAHINRLHKQVVCFKCNLTVGSYVALRMHKKKCDQLVLDVENWL